MGLRGRKDKTRAVGKKGGDLFPFLLISFQNLPFWGMFSKEVQSRMRVVHVNKVF